MMIFPRWISLCFIATHYLLDSASPVALQWKDSASQRVLQIGDVIQTWNHTENPTQSPTTSHPPSQSPTRTPTNVPTSNPTAFPTVSFAPTLSPSASPSDAPSQSPSASPSSKPSESPSSFPTLSPTVSFAPTMQPTDRPSSEPSKSPSASPSSSPTFVGTQSTFFLITLPIDYLLNSTEIDAFEEATATWINQNTNSTDEIGGSISQAQVIIEKQTLIRPPNPQRARSRNRQLQQGSLNTVEVFMLIIEFQVTAVFTGSDSSFNLYKVFDPLFQELDPSWVHILGNYNSVFWKLRDPATLPPALTANTGSQSKNVNMSTAGIAMLAVSIVSAVGLGVFAVSFGVKQHQLAKFGTELNSPTSDRGGAESNGAGFFDNEIESMLPIPTNDKGITNHGVSSMRTYDDSVGEFIGNPNNVIITSTLNDVPKPRQEQLNHSHSSSKNDSLYMLNSANGTTRRDDSLGEIFRGKTVSGRTGFDPPSAALDTIAQTHSLYTAEYMRRRALMDDNSTRRNSNASSNIYTSNSANQPRERRESNVTHSTEGSCTGKEIIYSETNSARNPPRSGTLAARPLTYNSSTNRIESMRSIPSFDSSSFPPEGLYHVLAPAGPLGIIVDSTKDGPAVHSLKASSPMRKLINPGDLIVALDNLDTRGMTADTLTRLMAAKSQQTARKITLLAVESY